MHSTFITSPGGDAIAFLKTSLQTKERAVLKEMQFSQLSNYVVIVLKQIWLTGT